MWCGYTARVRIDIPQSRARLARVLRDAGDIVRTDRAAIALQISHGQASKLLARWAQQGWLKRIGPGLYLPVPIDALESERVLSDPWLLVPTLFSPGFVSGWSAAEYWDLTEQIFRDIVVKTCRPLRRRKAEIHGVSFVLRHIKDEHLFGTKVVWRSQTRVLVADLHRCLVDMLDEPLLGGGIVHVFHCFRAYVHHDDADFDKLIESAERLGNGAVFKRLGLLAELEGIDSLVHACKVRLTTGHAELDPSTACPRMVTRWRLRVPESWAGR